MRCLSGGYVLQPSKGPNGFKRCASLLFAFVYLSVHLGSICPDGSDGFFGPCVCGYGLLPAVTESQVHVHVRSASRRPVFAVCVLFYLSGSADGKSLNLGETRRRLQALSLSLALSLVLSLSPLRFQAANHSDPAPSNTHTHTHTHTACFTLNAD